LNNNHEQYFTIAMSYIEIGRIASKKNWIHERFPRFFGIGNVTKLHSVGDYQNALAYQLFHAIELFLKYAISSKIGQPPKTHDLKKLLDMYEEQYPDSKFNLEHPFDFSDYEQCELNKSEQDLFDAHISKYKPEFIDQHLRYPADDRNGGYSFIFDTGYFEKMEKEFLRLHSAINNR
jgi:hypothetical protein